MTTVEPPAEAEIPTELGLADPASSATQADWEAAAAAVLRKARRMTDDDPDAEAWRALTHRTLDDVPVPPLGIPAQLDDLATSGRPERAGAWDVRAGFADADPTRLNRDLLTDLDNGVTSAWLRVGDGALAAADLAAALKGVLLDIAPVVLESDDPVAAADALLALAEGPIDERTNLGADPIGAAVRGRASDLDDVAAVAAKARTAGCLAIVVDGTAVHDLGASDAQELGYVLAAGAAYLRALERAGTDAADAAALIELRLAVTDEQFVSIAKVRAGRRLWQRVLATSAAGGAPVRVHAVTSRPMLSKYDPWVNMLRTTVAAFAAGVGGADAVTVLPFDSPLGVPDAFGRRIARNTSALLVEESHVATVADPAGGAYAVERLTDDLGRAGWVGLQRLESDGGLPAALPGLLERIDATVERREREIATRTRTVTGLTEFPNLTERLPERPPAPDDVRRYGHAFEALRDEPAVRPVYLATMGTVAAHTARATFAANLFAAGGITAHNQGAHDDAAAVVADYDGEPVACLCGTDAAYATWGADLVTALRDAGVARVVVAGKPGELGADDSCAVGVDALDFLHRTREALR